MRTETQSSQLGLRQRNGGGEVFDFGAMVEAFGRIRSRLIEIAGHQKGRDEYYRVLGAFRCGHANQFKSAAEARRAYRVLAAIAAQWEAEPPTAAEDVGPAQLGFWCGATEGRPQAEAEEYRCKSSGNEQCSRPRTIAGRMSHTSRRQDRRLRRQIRLKRNIRFPGRGLRRHTQAPNPHPGANLSARRAAGLTRHLDLIIQRIGCPEGGLVFDPFTGAGTTAVVSRRFGCRFLGAELDEEYCEIAAKRMSRGVLEFEGVTT